MPETWRECLVRWSEMNEAHRVVVEDEKAPARNVEYLLYQTLLGAWPVEPYDDAEYAEFVQRIQAYMEKATHEAKVHTSWINPNADYDDALRQFVVRILDVAASRAFLADLRAFQRRIARYGFFNSLAQSLLKITAPGAPDTYQGTELWDFSLVDPDNRRPVDYEKRRRVLGNLLDRAREPSRRGELVGELLDTMADGRIKLYVTAMALRCRREHPGLFSSGSYSPVEVGGPRAEHVFSFVRRHGERAALVAVPRLVAKLLPDAAGQPYGPEVWGETMLMLPEELAGRSWRSLFTGEILTPVGHRGQHAIPCALVFGRFPVALLLAHSEGGS